MIVRRRKEFVACESAVWVLADRKATSDHLVDILSKIGYAGRSFGSATALNEARDKASQRPHVVLLDEQHAEACLEPLLGTWREVPVVLIVADETVASVQEALGRGVFDFVHQPVEAARLTAVLRHATQRRRFIHAVTQLESEADRLDHFEGLIGKSASMRTVYRVIQNAAPTDVSVLISGASGTGKELVARALHQRSGRADKPFVAINMAAIPRDLVDATLFGHDKGAFTGADRERQGAVAEADGGTLFLDEVTEMPVELQPKLLRFLQERSYRRVGGERERQSNVRIISATNRDPVAEARAGRLRADLYYRLNVVPIEMPPLAERGQDIALLTHEAVQQFAAKHNKPITEIEPAAMQRLMQYDWPGNVRQLHNMLERLVVLSTGGVITADMLPGPGDSLGDDGHDLLGSADGSDDAVRLGRRRTDHLVAQAVRQRLGADGSGNGPEQADNGQPLSEVLRALGTPAQASLADPDALPSMEDLERLAIEHALRVCRSASKAAKALEISEATIYRKIKSFDLSLPTRSNRR